VPRIIKMISIFLTFAIFIFSIVFTRGGYTDMKKVKFIAAYGTRPLVGVINYGGTHCFNKLPDEISLTPPKWNYRLPFYAMVM
jgi:hypothetical protein